MTEFTPLEKLPVPESDIEALKERIQEFKELPGPKPGPQEIVKQSVKSIAPPAPPPPADDAVPPDVEAQVEALLQTAFSDGIYKANSAAQKSHPFVMDKFHDALTGQLYPELQKRGILP